MAWSKDEKNGCGCLLFLLFIICVASKPTIETWWANRKAAIQTEEARVNLAKWHDQERIRLAGEAAGKVKAEAELDAELKKFAKEFVPDLQQAIDKYGEQVDLFTDQRAAFARDMARLGVDPEKRPAYKIKGEIIEKMKADARKLAEDRRETYIRWKELSLLRDSADTKAQRDKLLQNAHKAAKSADETFEKYMQQSAEPDPK